MSHIDGQLSVGAYLKQSFKTIDGLAWIVVCIVCIICVLDISLGINAIPLRESSDQPKAIVLLLFSPLLVFLILLWLRLLPLGAYKISAYIRACFCLLVFFIINF